MPLIYWRENTVAVLTEFTGPACSDIVERCLKKSAIPEWRMTPANYIRFVRKLLHSLPDDIDRDQVKSRLRQNVFGRIEESSRRLPSWRETVTEQLALTIGPSAFSVVKQIIDESVADMSQETVNGLLVFLGALRQKLPREVDADDLLYRLKSDILGGKP